MIIPDAGSSSPVIVAILDPGLFWATALLATLAVALIGARRAHLDARSMYWACIAAIAGGIVGGHLLFVTTRPAALSSGTWLELTATGQSTFGVLLGGGLAGALCLTLSRQRLLPFADAAVPAVALGYALARVGCFFNGDDHGILSLGPGAVRFPSGTEAYASHLARGWISPVAEASLPVLPVQLYSALLGAGMFVLLLCLRPSRPGLVLAYAAILYSIGRLLLEPLRDDFFAILGPLSLPQVLALVLCATGAGLLLSLARQRRAASVTKNAVVKVAVSRGSGSAVQPDAPPLLRRAP
jgi:phosphatidylglycerol---prolipoprotein diacylglyceryl transferase